MLTATQALVFLPFVLPICIWAAWSDLSNMTIPNKSVVALFLVWVVVGVIMMDFNVWLWGFGLLGIVLVAGFILNAAGVLGAGDAKFGAAMAPFFVGTDYKDTGMLLSACLLGALVAHRGLRMVPAFRNATPGWKSWTVPKDFPVGLSLAGMLLFYLVNRLIVA
ncbi:MAG: prepilin peptidase [Paracoccaceae bacterium]